MLDPGVFTFDLVLLKPGSVELAGTGSIDGEQMEVGDDLAGCLELVSIHFGMRQQDSTGASNSGSSTDRPVLQDITAIK
jgi:type VI secretion system secreted protein Hcp